MFTRLIERFGMEHGVYGVMSTCGSREAQGLVEAVIRTCGSRETYELAEAVKHKDLRKP